MSERVDRLGAMASGLCAVHCALCALLPAVFGVLGVGFLLGHEAEWVFTLVAVAFATGALVLGWRRHRSFWVVGLLAMGIVGLLVSRGLEMGSGHHHEPHHDSHRAETEVSVLHKSDAVHQPEEHHTHRADKHTDSHTAHEEETTHVAGAAVGVLAGLLLLFGHVFNIRATRQCREECAT